MNDDDRYWNSGTLRLAALFWAGVAAGIVGLVVFLYRSEPRVRN